MSEQNKRVVRRFFREVWSEGNLALVDELFARDWVGHAPPDEFASPAELKQFIAALRRAFPDFEITVEDQVAEGDKVATMWTATGTHQGEFQGIPPTGKQQSFGGMTLSRIANGKIIEGWTNPDALGLLQQLGIVPAPEQSGR